MSTDNRFIPNSFQVPNALVDDLMAELSGAELKCYLAILRKTKGWNKESDAISVTQLMDVTGLSNKAVIDACNSLVGRDLLSQGVGSRGVKIFSVNLCKKFTSEKSSLVKKVHSTSEKSSLVTSEKSSHTKNNIKNTTKKTNTNLTVSNARATEKTQSEIEILGRFGIVGQLAKDFLALRKAKKLPLTETAMNGIEREAGKANLTAPEAVRFATESNWAGFKAAWYFRETCKSQSSSKPDAHSGFNERKYEEYIPSFYRED